jgi:hypothetical protein
MTRCALPLPGPCLVLLLCAALPGAACFESSDYTPRSSRTLIGGRSESQWRSQARAYERRLEALEAQIEEARDARYDSPSAFDRPSRPESARSIYARDEAEDRSDETSRSHVDRLEQQLEDLENEISDFELKARRLDVPNDWLR